MSNWTIVRNPDTNFEYMEHNPNKFYTVICKKGRTRTGYPVFDIQGIRHIETISGAQGIIRPESIIAYRPLDIPQEIINMVHQNSNTNTPSIFLEFYPYKN